MTQDPLGETAASPPLSAAPGRDMNRYKSLGPEHFSQGRFWLHFWVVRLFIYPGVFLFRRPKVWGRENIPRGRRFMVAANHISLWDPPLISTALDYPIAYMAKQELFGPFLLAEFLRLQGSFALDRESPDGKTLKTALTVLRAEAPWALGVFPEGTRSKTGEILPLKKGIGALAQKTQTPILPVGIRRLPTGKVEVRIGELITNIADAEQTQLKVYEVLVNLTHPDTPETSG